MADEKEKITTPPAGETGDQTDVKETGGDTGAKEEIKKPGKESQKIVMDKETFDKIMANQAELMKQVGYLRESVNQGRLSEAENKANPKELKRVFLKVWGRDQGQRVRVINGWKSGPQNKIIRNPQTNMPVGEVLQSNYFFLGGGETGLIEQVEFTRTEESIPARVVKDISPTEWIIKFEDPMHEALVDEKGNILTLEPVEYTEPEGKVVKYENAIRINKAFCNP